VRAPVSPRYLRRATLATIVDTRDAYGSFLAAAAGIALAFVLALIVAIRRLDRLTQAADRLEEGARRLERLARHRPTKDVRFLFDFGDPAPPELPEPAEAAGESDHPPLSRREARSRKSRPDE